MLSNFQSSQQFSRSPLLFSGDSSQIFGPCLLWSAEFQWFVLVLLSSFDRKKKEEIRHPKFNRENEWKSSNCERTSPSVFSQEMRRKLNQMMMLSRGWIPLGLARVLEICTRETPLASVQFWVSEEKEATEENWHL